MKGWVFEVFLDGELMKEVLFEGEDLWLGRDEDCGIRLDDRAISRKHALIQSTSNGIEFEKKSKFGSARVNGKDVDHAVLTGGERLEFGAYEVRVKKEKVPEQTKTVPAAPEVRMETIAAEPSSIALPPIEDPFAETNSPSEGGSEAMESSEPSDDFGGGAISSFSAPEAPATSTRTDGFDFASVDNDGATKVFNRTTSDMKYILEFGSGGGDVGFFEITHPETSIGRSQKCNLILEDKRSSRKHSVILRKGNQFLLQDQGSANGTLLNGERVAEQELHSGDVIKIGDTEFTFKMVQGDYEQKKAEFFQVPQEPVMAESYSESPAQMLSPMSFSSVSTPEFGTPNLGAAAAPEIEIPEPVAPDFSAPEEEQSGIIGKLLQRYRMMNPRQQIMWTGVVILGFYYFLYMDQEKKPVAVNLGPDKKIEKKLEKKPGVGGNTYDMLTEEQKKQIDSTYMLAFEHYKNRDYDQCLLEIHKIFEVVTDYKGAKEIETYAREGKRKLEAQEEERKRKELERQTQLKLQELLDKAGLLMEQKKYKEAEALFPEIEIMQPENSAVSAWRKKVIEEAERLQKEAVEKKRLMEINLKARNDYSQAMDFYKDKRYFDALDILDELVERVEVDSRFIVEVKARVKEIEGVISAERDPLLVKGKQFEQEGKLPEAYQAFRRASEVDPSDAEAPAGMERIKGSLNAMAKNIYSDGVIAEGFGDFEVAEKKYREVMEVVPSDNTYYVKAKSKLKIFGALKKGVGPEGVK
jgi:pSer/pThr/pTyr-binding forkhead associated (FHA) protein/tetratricopeptide (TPR) repeat protein